MHRSHPKSKTQREVGTDTKLDDEGSVTIGANLMEAAGLVDFEQVDVFDVIKRARLTTDAITGEPGSGEICVDRVAAHLVKPCDLVIIASYAEYSEREVAHHEPRLILVDRRESSPIRNHSRAHATCVSSF